VSSSVVRYLAAWILHSAAPVTIILCGTAPALAASATGANDAEAHIERGLVLRTQGRDAEALEEFEKAYALVPTPRAQAQRGLAQMAVGHYEKAEADLTAALDAQGDRWIAKNRPLLEKTLDVVRDKIGTLEVSGQPAGASVEVDGQVVAKLPCSIRVHSGEIALRVTAPGHLGILRTATVQGRSVTKEEFTLVPNRQTEGEVGPVRGRRSEPGSGLVSSSRSLPAPSPQDGSGLRIAGVALGVAGVASLATGAFFAFRAKSQSDDLSKAEVFDPAKDRGLQSSRKMEYLFLASGSALLVGGGVLYWLGLRDGVQEDGPIVQAQVLPPTDLNPFTVALTTAW
jgi:tetratricopeptide (TPR) repeat protein